MAETYDWSGFYEALCRHGPSILTGIDEDLREMIEGWGSTTDMFWSEGLQELLAQGTADGDLRAGVLAAIELWRENVLQTLEADFAIELDWQAVNIDTTSPLIDDLVEVTTPK
jgi:hypothetical protein